MKDKFIVPLEPEESLANTRLPKIPRNIPSLKALTKVSLVENQGYLLASEQSKRDSIRGGQCKIGYMLYIYICMYGWYGTYEL